MSNEKKAGFPKDGFILLCVLDKDTQSSEDLLGWVVMGKPPSLSLSLSFPFVKHFKAKQRSPLPLPLFLLFSPHLLSK